MSIGKEYSSPYAHFIAGGRTLEIIRQYEEDEANAEAAIEALRRELGAASVEFPHYFFFDRAIDDPRFVPDEDLSGPGEFVYEVNQDSEEGRRFQEKIDDIPYNELTFELFARRLTGAGSVHVNPDHLKDPSSGKRYGYEQTAAEYERYGEVYVVKVPRIVRGIFNESAHRKEGARRGNGYRYEWFTPPDSEPVPYSTAVALRERQLGSQIEPRRVEGIKVLSIPPHA